jgi:hypothetical protein
MSYRSRASSQYKGLGIGSKVIAKGSLGGVLKDIPRGAVGEVVDYFGGTDRPIVHFEGTPSERRIVVDYPEKELKIVQHVEPKEPRWVSKTVYYDEQSYDVDIPEFEVPGKYEMKINGFTRKEWGEQANKIWQTVPQQDVEAIEHYLSDDATDEEEKLIEEKYIDVVGDLNYISGGEVLFDYPDVEPEEFEEED